MRLTVVLDQDVYQALSRAAKAESRSLARQAGVMLRGAFEAREPRPAATKPKRRPAAAKEIRP